MEILEKVKILSGVADNELCGLMIEQATQLVLDYTNRKTVPQEVNSIIVDIAVLNVHKHKLQNVKSKSEGAISITYSDLTDLPGNITERLNRYRLLNLVHANESR